MLMLTSRLILKDRSDKQHCLPFVGPDHGIDIFEKEGTSKKDSLK